MSASILSQQVLLHLSSTLMLPALGLLFAPGVPLLRSFPHWKHHSLTCFRIYDEATFLHVQRILKLSITLISMFWFFLFKFVHVCMPWFVSIWNYYLVGFIFKFMCACVYAVCSFRNWIYSYLGVCKHPLWFILFHFLSSCMCVCVHAVVFIQKWCSLEYVLTWVCASILFLNFLSCLSLHIGYVCFHLLLCFIG